jgi:hypothetical protein
MLRKTTLVLRQNKQVILSSRKPICIPYLAQEKNLKKHELFAFIVKKKKKKSLRQKSPAETKKEKDDVRKTNQGNKSKKEEKKG